MTVAAAVTVTSWDALRALDPVITALHRSAGTPVTSRLPWWLAVGTAVGGSPVLLTVPGPGGTVKGAALLVLDERAGAVRVTSGRPYGDDAWEPAAVSGAARRALLAGVAGFVVSLDRPWTLELTGVRVPEDAAWLAAHLPDARAHAAAPVPGIRFGSAADLLFSHGVRRSLIRSGRRLRQARVREETGFERDPGRLAGLRAEIEAVHLARDDDAGRPSDLDDPVRARFWRAVYALHAGSGELEVATLRLDGELAAYVAGIDDFPAYRVLAGRHAPKWRQYSPGRRLEAWVADRVRDDGFAALDWGASIAPGAVIARNYDDPRWTVTAAAGPGGAGLTLPRRA
jgi:CelD/BcsL family acetyltransferase involved in cellulose biosynthesis